MGLKEQFERLTTPWQIMFWSAIMLIVPDGSRGLGIAWIVLVLAFGEAKEETEADDVCQKH